MNKSRFLRTLSGEACSPPPIWIMRQAGRYLPEYRETRARAGSFLDLCHNPKLACEVTLQPIRRFDFDAAILFSDILVVPAALGQEVRFEEGRGPVLGPMPDELLDAFDGASFDRALERVIETVGLVRSRLAGEKALIGFCGAPWTVASYMIAGHGTPDQMPARRFGLEQPERFGRLLDLLVEASAAYLVRQIEAGADVVMIFDSWAGILDEAQFRAWSCDPIAEMVRRVRKAKPEARVIAFARGAGARLGDFGRATSADALGVDWTLPMAKARELTGPDMVLQGNLDPLRLVLGGEALDSGIDAVLEAAHGHPHIFNLGHGVTPDTPVEHMARLVARVRGEGRRCST